MKIKPFWLVFFVFVELINETNGLFGRCWWWKRCRRPPPPPTQPPPCYGSWTAWSCNCQLGVQQRSRQLLVSDINRCSGPTVETGSSCSTDCVVSDWIDWGDCSVTCGSGTRKRSRTVVHSETCGGKCNYNLEEEEQCSPGDCPVDCSTNQWSGWSNVGGCPCGTTQTFTRERTIAQAAAGGGQACPDLSESEDRSCGCCPQNCMGAWGLWSAWSTTCGQATRSRNFLTFMPASCGGIGCSALLPETITTDNSQNDVDCQVSDWSGWTTCKLVRGFCGQMTQERTRTITVNPSCNGQSCPSPLKEERSCAPKCCPVNCAVTRWSDWNQCSAVCGNGEKWRSRTVSVNPSCGGSACPTSWKEKGACIGTTPIPCSVGSWSDWSPCDNQCGRGQMTRSLPLLTPADCGGSCQALSESKSCESYAANRDCLVTDWGNWGSCSEKCAVGKTYRDRTVSQSQTCNGASCPALQDSASCGLDNGRCQHQCDGSNGVCSCNDGYLLNNDGKSCSPADCGLPSVNHCPGSTLHGTTCLYPSFSCDSGTAYMQSCSVQCSVGYELKDGKSTISCQSSGAWTPYHASYCSRINKPPTKITLSNSKVEENVSPGFFIATFTTSDPNPKDTHSYQIIYPTDGKFKISGSSLLIDFSPDYESQNSYQITFRSTDNGGLYLQDTFTIHVTNVNEAPTVVQLSYSYVDENSKKGTAIGVCSATDPDSGQTHSYSLIDDAGGKFSLNGDQLQVAISNKRCLAEGGRFCLLNFEEKTSYTVKVRAQDNGSPPLHKDVSFTIHLKDINDRPRHIELSAHTLREDAAVGVQIGALSATEEDKGQSLTWKLVVNPGSLFGIQSGNKIVLKKRGINYEVATTYKITVSATDDGNPALSIDNQFSVDILDVNEPPAIITFTSTDGQQSFSDNSPSVEENSRKGTWVGTLAVFDPDANEKLTIQLDDAAGGRFSLKTLSLACKSVNVNNLKTECNVPVTVNNVLNYEVATSHSISVRVTDTKGHVKTTKFTIRVLNVNDAPTDVKISDGSLLSIAENKNGAKINGFHAIDEDPADTHTCELTDSAGGLFETKSNNLMTSASANLNYELKSQYNIVIRCTDSGSPRLSVKKSFTVHVLDINEVPTALSLSFDKISENSPEDTVVGRLTATDPDNVRVIRQAFTYTIIDSADGRFKVENGFVKVALSNARCLAYGGDECKINYESAKSHTIVVRVTDNGSPSRQKEFTLTIFVKDENDEPRNLALDNISVKENLPAGSLVGTISFSDEDVSQTASIVLTNDDNKLFKLKGNQLLKAMSYDYETKMAHNVTIVVTDDGIPKKSVSKTFTIEVLNVNEPPVTIHFKDTGGQMSFSVDLPQIKENSALKTVVGTAVAYDEDVKQTLVFSLDDNAGGRFHVATGKDVKCTSIKSIQGVNTVCSAVVTVVGALDHEKSSTHKIIIRVTDGGGLFKFLPFTVKVVDVNEKPTDITFADGPPQVSENANGAIVGRMLTTDPDKGQAHSYKLVNIAGGKFVIEGDTLKVSPSANLNYENVTEHTIQVVSTDSGSPAMSVTKTFVVKVLDVNEKPTLVQLPSNLVPENSGTGTTIGTLITVDPDNFRNSWQTFTYQFLDDDSGLFMLEGNIVKVKASNTGCLAVGGQECRLNVEAQQQHTVVVRATDSGSPPLSIDYLLTVNVTDVNDRPRDIYLSGREVFENGNIGTFVAVLFAREEDTSQRITFFLRNDKLGMFKIVGKELLTAKFFDYEREEMYNVTIVAKDNGSPPLEIATDVSIKVVNVNEAPFGMTISDEGAQLRFIPDKPKIEENSPFGTDIGKIEVEDPDENERISILLNVDTGGKFALGPVVCNSVTDKPGVNTVCSTSLLVSGDLDYETEAQYTVNITARDTGKLTTTRPFVIDIVNVNDPPEDIKLNENEIDENLNNHFIGNFSTVDQDPSDGHTYKVLGNLSDLYVIKENGLYTAQRAGLNFEAKNEYKLVVRSTDTGVPSLYLEQTFLIKVLDVNEAPINISVTNLKIREDCHVNDTVGVVSALDPDNFGPFGKRQNYTCSIIGNAFGRFSVLNNVLKVAASNFDFETNSSWSIVLRCRDNGNPQSFRDQQFLVTVVDVNESPISITMQIGQIPENEPTGQVAAKFTTKDQDTNDKIVYTVEGEAVDFPFEVVGSELRTKRSLDYEQRASWKVTIRATDSGGLFITETFQITVQDRNDKPTGLRIIAAVAVPENSAAGTYVGTVHAFDQDTQDTHSFFIVAISPVDQGMSGLFDLNSTTGTLTVAPGAKLNFEDVKHYAVRITATDSGKPPLSVTGDVIVNISNINEKPINIILNNTEVAENSPYNTLVCVVHVTDPDNENSEIQAHTCVVLNYPFVPFKMINNLSLIVARDSLDYEHKQFCTLEIRCFDNGVPIEFLDKRIVIQLTDVNEPPMFTGTTNYTIREDISVGEAIAKLSFTDPDYFVQNITYSLSTVNKLVPFDIEGSYLVTTASLDYETETVYSFNVSATDNAVPPTSTSVKITIHVQNENDQPERVLLKSNGVKEGSSGGTVVGEFVTVDPDRGQNFSYLLIGNANATDLFYIDGNRLVVVRGAQLNFEERSAISFTIRSTDNGSPPRSCQSNLTVNVLDVNERPEIKLQNNGKIEIKENSPPGTVLVNITIIDDDLNQTHVCRVRNGSGYFTIRQGAVVVANGAVIDYEKDPTVEVLIQCTDDGQPPLNSSLSFVVHVMDMNELASKIDLDRSLDISEFAPIGSSIANISVIDPDRGQNHFCSLSGPLANAFRITEDLRLVVAGSLKRDYSGKKSFTFNLTITCEDVSNFSLIFNQSFSFMIVDINEPPTNVFVQGSAFLYENATAGSLVGPLHFVDPEGDQAEMCAVLSVNSLKDSSDFYVARNSSGSFSLYLNRSLNYNKESSFVLEILASDDGTPPASAIFYLTIDVRRTDPCALGTAGCDPTHAICYRTAPTTSECKCDDGYERNGSFCHPIDYCNTAINLDSLKKSGINVSLTLCNNGYCINGMDNYTCHCNAGFLPPDCSDVDECASNPCGQGGVCNNLANGFTCDCLNGYTGTSCETDIDDCKRSPGQSLCGPGTCIDEVDGFSCTCPENYTGAFCSFSTTICAVADQCLPNKICVPKPLGANFVQGNGSETYFCISQKNEVTTIAIPSTNQDLVDVKDMWERKLRDDLKSSENYTVSTVYIYFTDARRDNGATLISFVVILNDHPIPAENISDIVCSSEYDCATVSPSEPTGEPVGQPPSNLSVYWPVAVALLGIVLLSLSVILLLLRKSRKEQRERRRRRDEVAFLCNPSGFGSRTNPLYSDDEILKDGEVADVWNPIYDSNKDELEPITFTNPIYERSNEKGDELTYNPMNDSAEENETGIYEELT